MASRELFIKARVGADRHLGIAIMPAVMLLVMVGFMGFASGVAMGAVPSPAWSIQMGEIPTDFVPGEPSKENEQPRYEVFVTNNGRASTDHSPITITDTLPAGLEVKSVQFLPPRGNLEGQPCKVEINGEISTVTCEMTEALELSPSGLEPAIFFPGNQASLEIFVKVPQAASGTLANRVRVQGGGAETQNTEAENQVGTEDANAGFEEFHTELTGPDGRPASGADSHPYQYTTSFQFNVVPAPVGSTGPAIPAEGDVKDVEVALPPGLVGNPMAIERCTAQQFNTPSTILPPVRDVFVTTNGCPIGSVVGVAYVQELEGVVFPVAHPIYNLVSPPGMPAQLGFDVASVPIYINTRLRSDSDYGVTAYLDDVTQAKRITASRITIWGSPWDPSHDRMRGTCTGSWETCPVEGLGTPRPFLRLPSSCQSPLTTTMIFDTWAQPVTGAMASSTEADPSECDEPPFDPTFEARPTTGVADSPSGLHIDLHIPQKQHEEAEGLGEADLRDTSVTLPEGLLVNPASADGLVGCSETQVGYRGVKEGRQSFSAEPAGCPDASKVGKVEVDTPLLDHSLPGSVYLASPFENPFGSLLGIYIAVFDPVTGVVVKLAGHVEPNPVTGQLTTTVLASPQVPFEDFKLDFFEGPRAPLRTPSTCGTFTTGTSLTPWTSPEGASVTPSDSFQIASAPGGGACPSTRAGEPNAPSFEAGTAAPTAGAYSPLVVHLSRGDGSQNVSRLNVTLPPGATGKLAGIPECSEAQIVQAQARNRPREGATEQWSPSCPSSSAIGTVTVGAGAGPDPFYVTGKAYLAGPYEGAPFSVVFITPAIAGPFDLGSVVVRAGLFVNPNSAQVTTKSDPLPTILDGVPLDVRSITVAVDRPGFILNPTNCNPLMVTGEEVSTQGQAAPLSSHFQVGSCQNLRFTPKFTVSTTGKTSKASGASLSVKVAYPAGSLGAQANLGRVDLQLPKQLPARLSTLQKACTEVQFNANPAGCPVASMIGTAKAITPLLSSPLTGPAILVSHGGAAFPDVEFLLQGEGVLIVLDGKTQIKKGITYSHFETIPDQPVSMFEATFPQGPYSVLATNLPVSAKNSLCGQSLTLPTILTAQDGAVINQTTKATVTGCAKTKTLTRAQKLALALKACHKKHNHAKRKACEHQAHKKYGPPKKAKKKRK